MPDRLIRLRRGRPGPAAAGAESKYPSSATTIGMPASVARKGIAVKSRKKWHFFTVGTVSAIWESNQ
jgi:hypothetical protein